MGDRTRVLALFSRLLSRHFSVAGILAVINSMWFHPAMDMPFWMCWGKNVLANFLAINRTYWKHRESVKWLFESSSDLRYHVSRNDSSPIEKVEVRTISTYAPDSVKAQGICPWAILWLAAIFWAEDNETYACKLVLFGTRVICQIDFT